MTPRPAPHIVRWFLRTFGYGGITLPPLGIYILAELSMMSRFATSSESKTRCLPLWHMIVSLQKTISSGP